MTSWAPVTEWAGKYLFSDVGEVWSIPRPRTRGGMLRQWRDMQGYCAVKMGDKSHRVHVWVATAFHGERPFDGAQVRHLNGDRADNRAANLAWGSASANALDRNAHGTMWQARRVRCPRGHLLKSPNLVQTALPDRKCRSCSNASSSVSDFPERDFDAEAAAYYARYLPDEAGTGCGRGLDAGEAYTAPVTDRLGTFAVADRLLCLPCGVTG